MPAVAKGEVAVAQERGRPETPSHSQLSAPESSQTSRQTSLPRKPQPNASAPPNSSTNPQSNNSETKSRRNLQLHLHNGSSSPIVQLASFPNTPLPLQLLAPPQIASLRGSLSRRRSSYPPATTPGSLAIYPWAVGGTPTGKGLELGAILSEEAQQKQLASFGQELLSGSGINWSSEWEGLLDFANLTPQSTPLVANAQIPSKKQDPSSETGTQQPSADNSKPVMAFSAPTMSPRRLSQFTSDLAWKTILSSIVEVEGVGPVGVSRVLQEVWKRGGGDVVTSQCLWPNIVMSLALAPSFEDLSAQRTGNKPSAHASMAIQQLYNLTLRKWEGPIFSGLLAAYSASSSVAGLPTTVGVPTYGAATPTREVDLSMAQWTNLTPGLGGDLDALFSGSTGFTPRGGSGPSNLSQYEFRNDLFEPRRASPTESSRGIDDILREMEEGNEAHEREMARLAGEALDRPQSSNTKSARVSPSATFQLPTPETDNTTPRQGEQSIRQSSVDAPEGSYRSPDSMASPFVTASSGVTSNVSLSIPTTAEARGKIRRPSWSRSAAPTCLTMPTEAFVPPPPMCMFFSPAFKDLQKGKVGVWKGDLDLKGAGGGVFSTLIVGEESTGHLWQSHTWPARIDHPQDASAPDLNTSPFTSKMIPVAYLAREGFTPIAMGMVLCNDANIERYVSLVQSLHAEGVAFHCPNPANLPIVFLPAKFDPADPLQRLGIAYMSKPGVPIPKAISNPTATAADVEEIKRQRKRRRQSAPASALAKSPNGGPSALKRVRAAKASAKDADKIEEEVIVEEDKT